MDKPFPKCQCRCLPAQGRRGYLRYSSNIILCDYHPSVALILALRRIARSPLMGKVCDPGIGGRSGVRSVGSGRTGPCRPATRDCWWRLIQQQLLCMTRIGEHGLEQRVIRMSRRPFIRFFPLRHVHSRDGLRLSPSLKSEAFAGAVGIVGWRFRTSDPGQCHRQPHGNFRATFGEEPTSMSLTFAIGVV